MKSKLAPSKNAIRKFKKELRDSNLELGPDSFHDLMKDWTEEGGNDPMDDQIISDMKLYIYLDPENEVDYRSIHHAFNQDYIHNL